MSNDLANGYVTSETKEGITTIEFFHPQSNSLPRRILQSLADEIHKAGNDNQTKLVILKSGGNKAFCAGASFDELTQIQDEKGGLEFFSGFAHVINAMRTCPKLIIARIQGKCVGGGVGLAASADYAIAVQGADVKLSELAVGIGPFVVGPAVERRMGLSAFSHLAIDASRWRSSDWAAQHGLFAELHPSTEAMEEAVDRMAKILAASSPEAMTAMKEIFWKGTEDWDQLLLQRAAISGRLVLSSLTKEAIAKFKAK